MRLLEFNRDDGGANPQQAVRGQPKREAPATPIDRPRKPVHSAPELFAKRQAKVFPVKTSTTRKPIKRGPIDLEQLQHRITVLEHRIQARAEKSGEHPAIKELELLKQRMKLLERNVKSELWAAKQREYQMLQLMAKPTLGMALRQRYNTLRGKTLPTLLDSLRDFWEHWWRNSQPHWWNRFASAWQESLDRARGISRY